MNTHKPIFYMELDTFCHMLQHQFVWKLMTCEKNQAFGGNHLFIVLCQPLQHVFIFFNTNPDS